MMRQHRDGERRWAVTDSLMGVGLAGWLAGSLMGRSGVRRRRTKRRRAGWGGRRRRRWPCCCARLGRAGSRRRTLCCGRWGTATAWAERCWPTAGPTDSTTTTSGPARLGTSTRPAGGGGGGASEGGRDESVPFQLLSLDVVVVVVWQFRAGAGRVDERGPAGRHAEGLRRGRALLARAPLQRPRHRLLQLRHAIDPTTHKQRPRRQPSSDCGVSECMDGWVGETRWHQSLLAWYQSHGKPPPGCGSVPCWYCCLAGCGLWWWQRQHGDRAGGVPHGAAGGPVLPGRRPRHACRVVGALPPPRRGSPAALRLGGRGAGQAARGPAQTPHRLGCALPRARG